MYSTVVATAENTLQALNRLVSVLRGRNFRIVSITTGRTQNSATNYTTIVADSTHTKAERIVSCLNKLDEVHHAEELRASHCLCREFAIVKVVRNQESESTIDSLVASHKARIADCTGDIMILETVGEPQAVAWVIAALRTEWIKDVVRVGPIAMPRGQD